ncbi:MAG: Csu type fimbrial protein [Aestuariivirga sp.]
MLQSAIGHAQSCAFTNTGVNFGNVNLAGGGTQSATGTFTANCTGTPLLSVRICANFNAGSGGVAASGDPRYMLQGATRLNYNLYRNNGVGQVWGSHTWAPSPLPPNITVNLSVLGSGSASQTIFGRIANGQGSLPAGTYQSIFSGTNTQIDYGYAALFNCGASLSSMVQNVPFTVRVTNNSSCTVSTTALDFGNQTDFTAARTATNAISVTCTGGTLYDIGLSNGSSGGTGPTARLMTNVAAPQAVTYGVYRNSAHTLPWGNTIGSDTLSATGNGLAQNYTGYGRIPVQPTPPALTYTDTVVVTVTY